MQYTEQLGKKLHYECVLPSMTFASETCKLTKALEWRLAAAQRNMERAMICVSRQDHWTNEWVRSKTKVRDITSLKPESGLGPVTWLAFKTIGEHPK